MRRLINSVKTASRSGVVDRSHTYGTRQMAFESLEGRWMLTSSFPHVIERSPDILSSSANFGSSVALGDRFAVVGAPNNGVRGAAFVYALRAEASTENWINVGKLDLKGDARDDDHFGFSVAISQTTIVVGAVLRDEATGAVYVFELSQSGDMKSMTPLPLPSDTSTGMAFGYSVAIDGDTIVVGAPFSKNTGAAFVYTRSSTDSKEWIAQQTLMAGDADFADDFGMSVAIDGGTIAVGANRDDDAGPDIGAVYTFTNNSGGWAEEQKLTASDGHTADCLGFSVALSGNTLVAGAFLHDGSAPNTGAAYVFHRDNSRWSMAQKLEPIGVGGGAMFGQRVAISEDLKILVAAPGADIPAAATRAAAERTSIRNAGKAFLYRLDGPVEPRSEGPVPSPVWVEADSFEFVAPKPSNDDEYGFGVAVSDATVLVGAPYVDNSVDTGSAFFYTDPPILAMSSPKPVHAGSTTVLTKADLDLIAEPTAKKIVFELLSIPQHGALLRDGNPLLAEQTFTREDIANGLVSYIHEVPDTRSDGFTFTATADDIFMVPGTDEFIFAINGPPTLSNIESSPVEYREGAEPIQITEDITVQDDSDMIREATVIIQSGFEATADELGFLATNKIRGEWNDKTMTLALTGLATVTEYQQALRSVTFSSDPTIVAAAADDVGSVPLPTTLDRILMASDEGDFVKLGDMTFGQFSYTRTGNSPGASQVTVSSPDGEALRFTGPFFDLPDAEVSTATIEYTVTGNDIYRVTLAGNPSILGTSAGESRVTETVQPENQELVIFNIKPGEPPLMVEDARQITPADTLDVVTEIFLESRDLDAGSVTLSVIEQRFIAEGRSMRTIEFVVVDDDGAVSNTVSRQIIVRDSTDPGVIAPGPASARFAAARNAARKRLRSPSSQSDLRTSADQITNPVHDLSEANNKQPRLKPPLTIPWAESSESDDQPRQVQVATMSDREVDAALTVGDLGQTIKDLDYLDS